MVRYTKRVQKGNKKRAMTKKDLQILRKRLPDNYVREIQAELTPNRVFSAIYIKKVIAGDRNNNDILIAAIKVAEKHEEVSKQIANAARGKNSINQILEDNA